MNILTPKIDFTTQALLLKKLEAATLDKRISWKKHGDACQVTFPHSSIIAQGVILPSGEASLSLQLINSHGGVAAIMTVDTHPHADSPHPAYTGNLVALIDAIEESAKAYAKSAQATIDDVMHNL